MALLTFEQLFEDYILADHEFEEFIRENDFTSSDKKLSVQSRSKLEEHKWKVREALDKVLGHPESFDNVRNWMVNVNGQERRDESSLEVDLEALVEEQDKVVERLGGLPTSVRNVMKEFNLTDSGIGSTGWNLGCHCTEKEAKQLCTILYKRFAKAISEELLVVERKPWALQLKDTPEM